MADRVGQQLGNYQLIRLLGSSDSAAVYLAQALPLKEQVVLKRFLWPLVGPERARFLTEARAVASLRHPALLPLLDVGLEGDAAFLVMAYAHGGTLRRRHPQGSRLPIPVLLSYLHQLVPALHTFHEHGFLHGSIKPENMVVGGQEHLFLSEGGLAVLTERKRSLLLQRGTGSVAYLAPEQLRGQPEPASDQYALGMVVAEWLTGALPFHGSLQEVISQQRAGASLSLREKAPWISSLLERVVLKALAPEPGLRFASVQAFAAAFEEAYQATRAALGEPVLPAPALHFLVPTGERSPPTKIASAAGTLICTYREHAHRVQMVAWSPDGRHLASASRDKTVQVWEAATGKHVFSHQGHTEQVHAVVWSPDGGCLASASDDGTVQVWAAGGGSSLIYRRHAPAIQALVWFPPIHALAWSPDGTLLASDHYQLVEVWEAFTGRLHLTYGRHTYGVNALAWSPDGKYLASASNDRTLLVWEPTSGNTVFTHSGHSADVLAVAWSPDGKYLASGSADHTVHIWSSRTVGTICTYGGHTAPVNALAWSPNGRRLASASNDGTVQVWEAATGNTVFLYQRHAHQFAKRVNTVAWSPDGTRIASAGDDKTVQVWQAP